MDQWELSKTLETHTYIDIYICEEIENNVEAQEYKNVEIKGVFTSKAFIIPQDLSLRGSLWVCKVLILIRSTVQQAEALLFPLCAFPRAEMVTGLEVVILVLANP